MQDHSAEGPVHFPPPDPEVGYDESSLSSSVKEAHAIASLEMVHSLKDDIVLLEEQDYNKPVPEVDEDPLSPFGGPKTEPLGGDDMVVPKTVSEILKAVEMRQFKPPKKDSAMKCLERVRLLSQPMRLFVRKVRLHEKILSRAQITGKLQKHCGRHHRFEHMLARLRRKYALNAVRQSRFAAWAFFSSMVAKKASPDAKGAAEFKQFIPSCSTSGPGERRYQIVAVRGHVLGKPMFALVEEVVRGSLTKKGRRTGKKVSEHPVDAAMVASIRAILLEPVAAKDAEGLWHFRATVKSPSGVFDMGDDDGSILWVVPEDMVSFEETPISLELWIKDEAYKALRSSGSTWIKLLKDKGLLYFGVCKVLREGGACCRAHGYIFHHFPLGHNVYNSWRCL